MPDALRNVRLHAVVVDPDVQTLAAVCRPLSRRFEITLSSHVVDGLLAVAMQLPDVLVAGDVSPLDMRTLAARLEENEATGHVRVVALGDPHSLRVTLEALTA
jgi:hypothetical protein